MLIALECSISSIEIVPIVSFRIGYTSFFNSRIVSICKKLFLKLHVKLFRSKSKNEARCNIDRKEQLFPLFLISLTSVDNR